MGRWTARGLLLAVALLLGLALRPLAPLGGGWSDAAPNVLAGLAFALSALAVESALRSWNVWKMAGGALGVLLGGLVGVVVVRILPEGSQAFPTAALRPFVYLVALYAGGVGGIRLAATVPAQGFAEALTRDAPGDPNPKVLDTSVIIDGRIADVCETGFLEGTLVVPTFVLRELQYVADSAEPMRRARGRKGLECLQRIKKTPGIRVVFSAEEIPEAREVDQKLIELARRTRAKLLTNDLNLNKVASLRGIEVLNLNDLANAMKPVVLPGEGMRVNIVREGKEPNQGVAYLDDGTMVVVDNARSLVGRSTDIVVTSVIQTTAGKMFFGKPTSTEPPRNGQDGAPLAEPSPSAGGGRSSS